MATQLTRTLPIPPFFNPNNDPQETLERVGGVWRVPYLERAQQAEDWARKYNLSPAAKDRVRVGLLIVDAQNTFCIPEFELFVMGQSGMGAVEDNVRLCQFIYRNLGVITQIAPTMDTHTAMQIFHPIFLINDAGQHPSPAMPISLDDIRQGAWKVNPAVAQSIAQGNYAALQQHLLNYAAKLKQGGKYDLTSWPYHAMLGGIGHALVSAVEEACFFHNIARHSQTAFQIKGGNPLTENYSVLRPEVLEGPNGQPIAQKNTRFIKMLLDFDVVVIAGQAKSHCVAWTIDDLLGEITAQDPELAKKVYLLEDCTSPVVIPNVVDFTEPADQAFQRFGDAGMHVVLSTEPIEAWPDVSFN